MIDILSQRKAASDLAELAPQQNRISAQSLSYLLDERKMAKSRSDLEKLASEYGIDVDVLEQLATFVNAPSVSSVKTRKEDLEETQIVSVALLLFIIVS